MTKGELAEKVAIHADLSQAASDRCVSAALQAIAAALGRGEKVSLPGFGSFEVREQAAREGRNPRTGEAITIAARKVPAFRAGKALKDRCNGVAGR